MIKAVAWLNLAIVFCVELAGLAAFAVWGAQAVRPTPGRLTLAIATPLVAATLWGLFCAPRAAVSLPAPAVVGIKLAMLSAAALALVAADHPSWAVALLAVALTTAAIARRLPKPMSAVTTER